MDGKFEGDADTEILDCMREGGRHSLKYWDCLMTREGFEHLSRYFHLNDTRTNPLKGQNGQDKLCHIRLIYDAVLEKCLGNYDFLKEQSIDEGMIDFKGRLSFQQYLPAKPTKFDIKVWGRAAP